jgi:hypothetical protein
MAVKMQTVLFCVVTLQTNVSEQCSTSILVALKLETICSVTKQKIIIHSKVVE